MKRRSFERGGVGGGNAAQRDQLQDLSRTMSVRGLLPCARFVVFVVVLQVPWRARGWRGSRSARRLCLR